MLPRLSAQSFVHFANLTLRVVVAAYVLAAAVALAMDPAQLAPLGGLFGKGIIVPVVATYLFTTGSLLMIGRHTRTAALLLCAYLFCDAWFHLIYLIPGAFWNDVALLTTVLLVSNNTRRLAESEQDAAA